MYIFSKRPTLCISMQYFADPAAAEPDAPANTETKAFADSESISSAVA